MSSQTDKTSLEWYASRVLPPAQIRKFRIRQDLLAKELEKEAEFPEVSNVLGDIFTAVKEKNFGKFLMAHKHLNGRIDEETVCHSIRYNILSKKEPLTKREAIVLSALQSGKSLLEVF